MQTGAPSLWGPHGPPSEPSLCLALSRSLLLSPSAAVGQGPVRQSARVRGIAETPCCLQGRGRCRGGGPQPPVLSTRRLASLCMWPWGPEARRSLPLAVFLLSERGVPGSPPPVPSGVTLCHSSVCVGAGGRLAPGLRPRPRAACSGPTQLQEPTPCCRGAALSALQAAQCQCPEGLRCFSGLTAF